MADSLDYSINFTATTATTAAVNELRLLQETFIKMSDAGMLGEEGIQAFETRIDDLQKTVETGAAGILASFRAIREEAAGLSTVQFAISPTYSGSSAQAYDAQLQGQAEFHAALSRAIQDQMEAQAALDVQLGTSTQATAVYNQYLFDEATALQASAQQLDAHVQAYYANEAALSAASKENALYNQYLYDEAKAAQASAVQLDAHVKAYEANMAAASAASKETAIYNKYLYDQAQALLAVAPQMDAHVKAYEAQMAAASAASKETALYNQYLYDEAKAAAVASTAVRGMGNFYPLILASTILAGVSGGIIGLGTAAETTAASYQQAFAQVARTTQTTAGSASQQINHIYDALEKLDTQIPVTFQDLSKIATAGNELGVSADSILSFTKTVAEYSTVTGTSIDETSTAFGSIGQILGVTSGEYENLGSAISYVGRLSVATEPEIVTMTQKIAATAHQAGLTAQEIIGLSGTLASLREAPERSQGALEIYFKTVNLAAADGGKKLEAFAEATHMSVAATKEMIANSPLQFLEKLLGALSQMNSVDQTKQLSELGLSGTRVSEVLRRLSGNIPLLTKLLGDANSGYASGTDLQNQYAKTTDTVTAKFTELQNAVTNLFAAFGGSNSNAISILLGALAGAVTGIADFVKANPLIANMVIGIGALVAGFFALEGAIVATNLVTLAFANLEARSIDLSVMGGLSNLKKSWTSLMAAITVTRVAQTEQIATTAAATGALEAETAATEGAVVATNSLKGALISTGIGAVVVLLGTLASSFLQVDSAASNFIDSTTLSGALAKDQAQYDSTGKAIRQLSTDVTTTKTTTDSWVPTVQKATGAQVLLSDATQKTTQKLDDATVAFGKNAKAALASALANNQAFQNIFKGDTLSKVADTGFDMDTYTKKLVGGDPKAAKAYADQIIAQYRRILTARDTLTGRSTVDDVALQSLQKLSDAAGSAANDLTDAASKSAAQSAANKAIGITSQDAAAGLTATGEAAQGAGDAGLDMANAYNTLIAPLFTGVNAAYAQAQALQAMGTEAAQSGVAAAFAGTNMQAYIKSVVDNAPDALSAADTLVALRDAIIASGQAANATAPQLQYLNDAIATLANGQQTSSVGIQAPDFSGYTAAYDKAMKSVNTSSGTGASGIGKVGDAAAETAKKVYTLVDYANDLSGVFTRAFDLRTGAQTAKDAITTQFDDMKKAALDAKDAVQQARDKVRQIQLDMEKARADNVQQKYFLSVAQQFGDTMRTPEIQSNIDTNNSTIGKDQGDLSSANRDLASALDAATHSLTGNSAGAIANRTALESLVQKYQDYITKLASSGLSQDELKKKVAQAKDEFIKQATQLGYTKDSVDKAAKSFDDMGTIITKLPRNITVSLHKDAAEQALAEFQANVDKTMGKLKKSLGGGGGGLSFPHITDPNSRAGIEAATLKNEIAALNAIFGQQTNGGSRVSNASLYLLKIITGMTTDLANYNYSAGLSLASGYFGYAEGGYTGAGGKYQPAGIVHRGEYVVPKEMVNQSTGMPFADALGKLVHGTPSAPMYASGGYVGNNDMLVTELGPRSLGVLRQIVAKEMNMMISSNGITSAVNSTNAQNRRRGR